MLFKSTCFSPFLPQPQSPWALAWSCLLLWLLSNTLFSRNVSQIRSGPLPPDHLTNPIAPRQKFSRILNVASTTSMALCMCSCQRAWNHLYLTSVYDLAFWLLSRPYLKRSTTRKLLVNPPTAIVQGTHPWLHCLASHSCVWSVSVYSSCAVCSQRKDYSVLLTKCISSWRTRRGLGLKDLLSQVKLFGIYPKGNGKPWKFGSREQLWWVYT